MAGVALVALRIPFAVLGAVVGGIAGMSLCSRLTWRYLQHRITAEEL